jgi:hypothetical protein
MYDQVLHGELKDFIFPCANYKLLIIVEHKYAYDQVPHGELITSSSKHLCLLE